MKFRHLYMYIFEEPSYTGLIHSSTLRAYPLLNFRIRNMKLNCWRESFMEEGESQRKEHDLRESL